MGVVARIFPSSVPLVRRGYVICLQTGLSPWTCQSVYYFATRTVFLALILAGLYVLFNVWFVYQYIKRRDEFVLSFKKKRGSVKTAGRKITLESFEKGLPSLEGMIKDRTSGLLGCCPTKTNEKVSREAMIIFGGGPAVMLQLAHPFVAFGIAQHSYTTRNIRRRFYHTFKNVFAITFGSLDAVLAAGRTVCKTHQRIKGTITEDAGAFPRGYEYSATDEAAAMWVFATLIEHSVLMYEICVGPLTDQEKEASYAFTRKTAVVWGIEEGAMPPTWPEFLDYCGSMFWSPVLTVSSPARGMVDFLLRPLPWERALGLNSIKPVVSVLLPLPVREQYGMKSTFSSRLFTAVMFGLIRSVLKILPGDIRYFTQYHQWSARRRGDDGNIGFLASLCQRCGDWFVQSYLAASEHEPVPLGSKKKVV